MGHFGGTFTRYESNFGSMYKYEGGEVSSLGIVSGVIDFKSFMKKMTDSSSKICGGNLIIYALIDGIRFRVDDINDLSFQWEVLQSDENGFIHFYCVDDQISQNINSSAPAFTRQNSPSVLPPIQVEDNDAFEFQSPGPLSFTNFIISQFGSPPHKLAVKRQLDEIYSTNIGAIPTQESQGNNIFNC